MKYFMSIIFILTGHILVSVIRFILTKLVHVWTFLVFSSSLFCYQFIISCYKITVIPSPTSLPATLISSTHVLAFPFPLLCLASVFLCAVSTLGKSQRNPSLCLIFSRCLFCTTAAHLCSHTVHPFLYFSILLHPRFASLLPLDLFIFIPSQEKHIFFQRFSDLPHSCACYFITSWLLNKTFSFFVLH